MGYTEKTLNRVIDVLDYLGSRTNYAPEPEQKPFPVWVIIAGLKELGHSERQIREAIDIGRNLGALAGWTNTDLLADRRQRLVVLTAVGLATLRDASAGQAA